MAAASQNSNNNVVTDQLLVEEHMYLKKLILNRPRHLNALSFEIVSQARELLIDYEKNQDVKLVITKGKGKAFCIGGDMAALTHAVTNGNLRLGAKFFYNAYFTAYIMATFIKPIVSILNGIVMGGGAAFSIHCRFRVVTETTVFAMPETALGLFPDGGASYFLSRLPGFFGEYIGLTGKRLDGAEMLACGLATHFVPLSKLTLLEEALNNSYAADPSFLSAIINGFSQRPHLKERSAYHRLDIIDKCFSKGTVEEILTALETEAAYRTADEYWISKAVQSIKKASPTSLKISLSSIRKGRLQGVDQCLIQDYRVCYHVLRGDVSKDFFEGCRAILWDKDRNPKWEPSKLELVSDKMVDQYFSEVNDDEEWEDLVLPVRFHSPAQAMAKI